MCLSFTLYLQFPIYYPYFFNKTSRNSQSIGGDQQVGIIEQDHQRPLKQQHEGELNEQHQGQLAYTADVQEHRAGQQSQQHAVGEVLENTHNHQQSNKQEVETHYMNPKMKVTH